MRRYRTRRTGKLSRRFVRRTMRAVFGRTPRRRNPRRGKTVAFHTRTGKLVRFKARR